MRDPLSASYASIIKAFVIAAIMVGCAGAPPAPTTPTAAFDPSDVTRAIDVLASAGVAVRIDPSDAPLVAPTGQSRVNLLRFQVRNLALEAHGGGGSRGSEMDEFAIANGGLPISFLIAGWARTAGTPAATAASVMLGGSETVDPSALRIPGMVTALFLADMLQGPAADAARPLVASVSGTVAESGFCDEVGAYLSGVLEGMLDPALALAPAWLQGAVDSYPLLENDPAKLRNAVAATAILVYATSISRPWLVAMSAAPLAVHYVVAEDELSPPTKSVLVSVDSGDGTFAEEVNGCAELADAQLGETEVDGSRVTWLAPGIVKHGRDIEGDLEIENGTALFQYQTNVETAKAHKEGTLRNETVIAYAIIERQDINALTTLVERLLGGSGILAPNVRGVYERLKPQLDMLLYPRGWQPVEVSWHGSGSPTPPPATRDPSGSGSKEPCAGGKCAGSNGDPHLRTVDGQPYDFQAAGEFTLLRSPDGAIDIQARQVPYGNSTSVSINTALALSANGRRVGLYVMPDNSLDLKIDGTSTTQTTVDLGSGATVTAYRSGFEIRLPDGTIVWGLSVGRYGINVIVAPSATMRDTGSGILGRVPAGTSLPSMPDGSARPADSDYYDFLYGSFADAWQVTDTTTLFDYESGTSTATFAMPDFPAPAEIVTIDLLDPALLASGQAACAAISDPDLREECIFDVAITGDQGFVDGYVLTDAFLRSGTDALGGPGGGPLPTDSVSLPVGPLPDGIAEILPSIASLLGSASGADGMLYLSVRMPNGTFEVLRVDPEDGRITTRVDAQGGGQVAVTEGAIWVGEFTGGFTCSVTRLDSATLDVQATVATPCTQYYTELAATADALWYQDIAGLQPGDPGAKLSWIDPATNQVAGSVALPYTLGTSTSTDLRATDTSMFFGFNADDGYHVLRLRPGDDGVISLPTREMLTVPVGDGIWAQEPEGTASFFSTSGGPDRSIAIEGTLVAADNASLYVQRFGAQDYVPELWRYSLDATAPVVLARGATIGAAWGDQTFAYTRAGPLFQFPSGLAQLRLVYATQDISESRVLIEWIPSE